MTPTQAAATTLAIIQAFTPVVLALAALIGLAWTAFKTAMQSAQLKDIADRQNRHGAAISALQQQTTPANPPATTPASVPEAGAAIDPTLTAPEAP